MVRFKHRYLVAEVNFADGRLYDQNLNGKMIYKCLLEALKENFGDYGYGSIKTNLRVKYVNPYTRIAKIRCKRDMKDMVQAAMFFIKKVENVPAIFRTLHCAGSMRSCQKFLVEYNQQELAKIVRACKDPEEKRQMLRSINKSDFGDDEFDDNLDIDVLNRLHGNDG
ncbi:unnamed protein product [Dimorphilus gyrociliatus]|uniref:Ribonuclease P/MRP protein subunit POP5 n=1 Tax=Dimorphilus gyrociliatus TaxID=2664684 RepID=A0A7I8VQ85_9ANNE|nr:unnamed protein product [Dimorphilus gyrociliatus]